MGSTPSVLVMLFALFFIERLEFICSNTNSNLSCIASEREALMKFKGNLTDEANRLSSWVGKDCCTWKGVGCSDKTGHVVKLDLHYPIFDDHDPNFQMNQLRGQISPSLLDLNHLNYLDLSMNSFYGPLPSSLGRLSYLRVLYTGDNQLNGSIPISLGQLSKLEYLDLSNNSFVGTVFELHFAKLKSLNELYLHSNSLVLNVTSQWIPPFQLQVIQLSSITVGPQFPQWLETQKNVTHLYMSNASISDVIPDWFESIYCGTIYLDLSNNQIKGKVPISQKCKYRYGNGAGDKELLLSSNRFEGPLTLPSDFYFLDLFNNLLSGPITVSDDNATMRFMYLVLSNNHLTGVIPVSLCKAKDITLIDFSNNQLLGKIPPCLG
ncbi:receptor-like protein EIX2 [Camellia sinensis]|nr:receptor-like protein EIX2 [Camellia sinensis]